MLIVFNGTDFGLQRLDSAKRSSADPHLNETGEDFIYITYK